MVPYAYQPDVLGPDFEQRVLPQPPDYEGPVQSTLIRRRPRGPRPRRAVLYVHGFTDYFFQQEMAVRYEQHGYQFYALDLRKYGRSWLPHQWPNNVRNLREYYPDLDAALAVIQAEGHRTVVLSGHSTGGLIAALYAEDSPNQMAIVALVLNSPFLAMHQNWLNRHVGVPLAAAAGRWLPGLKIPANLPTEYGQSLHRQYRGEWDYYLPWKPIEVFPVTTGWLRAIHAGHRRIRRGLGLTVPVLVLHSTHTVHGAGWTDEYFHADGVLNVRDIHRLAPRLGSRVTVRPIEGGMHDLVLSAAPVRARVYQELFGWLQATLGE
ncbi:alpha/beta hydrolase [Hymenobacter persicinus]|uniref:Alpha/beta hydrolase n=1 Tax=Hymenobacter persicinus TaxID=2025506 RepID=A0A4Q5L8G6_9BACT|nr:alpha/beta hydrolase [Hymenobacter persicinus]RYU74768.1 alpha/beta hydrolase [Hymenobacter persicinus]